MLAVAEKSTIIISSNDEDDSMMEPSSVTVVPSNQEMPTLPIEDVVEHGDADDEIVLGNVSGFDLILID